MVNMIQNRWSMLTALRPVIVATFALMFPAGTALAQTPNKPIKLPASTQGVALSDFSWLESTIEGWSQPSLVAPCYPSCVAKQCGDDGCGGSCGECDPGIECNENGICSCPDFICGEKTCAWDGCLNFCPADLCGDGAYCAHYGGFYQCVYCSGCNDVECGMFDHPLNYFCGGPTNCGNCAPGLFCKEGAFLGDDDPYENHCADCATACQGKQCGPHPCGVGDCGTCPEELTCHAEAGLCVLKSGCESDPCGLDPCGIPCTDCGPGMYCEANHCLPCQGWCDSIECGTNPCAESCGTCDPGSFCSEEGECVECNAVCQPGDCGLDSCGAPCGECEEGWFCSSWGTCKECNAICDPGDCGPDSCGVPCSECGYGLFCAADWTCKDCFWECADRQCGPGPCGSSCGTCPAELVCTSDGHCVDESDIPAQSDVISDVVDISDVVSEQPDITSEQLDETSMQWPENCGPPDDLSTQPDETSAPSEVVSAELGESASQPEVDSAPPDETSAPPDEASAPPDETSAQLDESTAQLEEAPTQPDQASKHPDTGKSHAEEAVSDLAAQPEYECPDSPSGCQAGTGSTAGMWVLAMLLVLLARYRFCSPRQCSLWP